METTENTVHLGPCRKCSGTHGSWEPCNGPFPPQQLVGECTLTIEGGQVVPLPLREDVNDGDFVDAVALWCRDDMSAQALVRLRRIAARLREEQHHASVLVPKGGIE